MFYELRFNVWNVILLVSIVIGLTFTLLLFFTHRKNKQANRFLVKAFLRPEYIILEARPENSSSDPARDLEPSAETLEQGKWLQKQMEANLFYLNAELSLQSLAEDLDLHPHTLSRIINQGIGTNFTEFVNEYRVREVINKMQDPALQHITLLGIAYDSGFNSKTSFNRVFKNKTGKTPSEFRDEVLRKS